MYIIVFIPSSSAKLLEKISSYFQKATTANGVIIVAFLETVLLSNFEDWHVTIISLMKFALVHTRRLEMDNTWYGKESFINFTAL